MTASGHTGRTPDWIRGAAVAFALAWFAGLTAAFRVQPASPAPKLIPVNSVRYIPHAPAADGARKDPTARLVSLPTLFALPSTAGFSRPFIEESASTPLPEIAPDLAVVRPIPDTVPEQPPVYRVQEASAAMRSAPKPIVRRPPALSIRTDADSAHADTASLAASLREVALGEAPWSCEVTVRFGPDGVPRHVILGPGPAPSALRERLARRFYGWRIAPPGTRIERIVQLSYAGAHRVETVEGEPAP